MMRSTTIRVILAGIVIGSVVFGVRLTRPERQDVLLLGLAERGDTHERSDRFTTHWITHDGDTARQVRELAGLIVPRDSAFLRIGITRLCVTDSELQEPRVHCADSLWVQAATSMDAPAHVLIDHPCTTDYTRLDFASPAVLSVFTHSWTSDCSQRSFSDGNTSEVRRYDTEGPLPFSTLGPGASTAYQSAASAARNTGALDGPPTRQGDDCRASSDDTGWRIRRDRDRWIAALFQQHGSELCILEAPIPWELGADVLGSPEPLVNWPVLVRGLPEVEMAFVSPSGRTALLVASSGVRLYALTDGRPSRPLLEYPRSDVVMVQWARGRSAVRWARLLPDIR
jgi:hypothetical protein